MLVVYIALMVVALIGMIICSKKQNSVALAKPLSMVLLLVVAFCGVMVLKSQFSGGISSLRENENRFYVSQAFVVGDYVKGKFDAGKTLIIADPSYKADTRMTEFVEMMKKGSSGEVVIDTVELPETNEEMAEYFAQGLSDCGFAYAKNKDKMGLDTYHLDGADVYVKWQNISEAENTVAFKVGAVSLIFLNVFAIFAMILFVLGFGGIMLLFV